MTLQLLKITKKKFIIVKIGKYYDVIFISQLTSCTKKLITRNKKEMNYN